jgi:hypothetical protein
LIKDAGRAGAALVVFPETFIPTYPDWVWRVPPWSDGDYVARLYAQAVPVPGPTVEQLGAAAREAGAYVAIGVNELAGGTLYNTLLYLAPDGSLAGRHRKLMPTGGERTAPSGASATGRPWTSCAPPSASSAASSSWAASGSATSRQRSPVARRSPVTAQRHCADSPRSSTLDSSPPYSATTAESGVGSAVTGWTQPRPPRVRGPLVAGARLTGDRWAHARVAPGRAPG